MREPLRPYQHVPRGQMPNKFRGYTCLVGVSYEEVAQHARGAYQAALLYGSEAWSGATLKGKAGREYGRSYQDSRCSLENRLDRHFDLLWVRYGKGSRKVLCIYPKCTPEVLRAYEQYQQLP